MTWADITPATAAVFHSIEGVDVLHTYDLLRFTRQIMPDHKLETSDHLHAHHTIPPYLTNLIVPALLDENFRPGSSWKIAIVLSP